LRAPSQGFVDQRPADASIGSRDQNRPVGYIHSVRHGENLLSSLTTVSVPEKIRAGSESAGSSGHPRLFFSFEPSPHPYIRLVAAAYSSGERRIALSGLHYSNAAVFEYVRKVVRLYEQNRLKRCSIQAPAQAEIKGGNFP